MKRLALLALLCPSAALAHTGHGAGFLHGLEHPLGGADHLLAMFAVGLWAAAAGGRAIWALPLAFLAGMLGGGVLGMAGLTVPGVEPLILASIILLGAAVALVTRPPLVPALMAVACFGLAHGNAHGLEAPATGFAGYAAGFFLATAGLHGAGLLTGRLLAAFQKAIGLAIAAAGALLTLS
jgi:urease accessory protein